MFRIAIWPQNGAEENQWDYVLSNLKPDETYVLGPYQCTNNVLRDAPRLETLEDAPDVPIIILAPLTSRQFVPEISILDFEHPEDALYVFGPNNEHLMPEDVGGREYTALNIPTDTTDEMFNYSAYLITAWERRRG